ncbi:CDPK-related kinase 2-like [Curcuma longa]|uniref:CDPK-related kinase 2-like n=1 Tax=Curcuma longa TaxID=136217 RepID=UPI003D9DE000
MTTAIEIKDVHREVKILKYLSGHANLVKFYEAYEDDLNVYIIMELCGGGELLDRILSKGGKYKEKDAKVIVIQILSVIAFCHLQGVVHRDLKPENFLFTTKDENAPMKIIDFGLSDFIRPGALLGRNKRSSFSSPWTYFSKWVEAEALARITEEAIIKFLWKSIICRYGIPHRLVSDNGRQFQGKKIQVWCQGFNIQQAFTSVAYPQANGQAEVTNQEILRGLKTKLDHE